jgi:hypothetical protein
MIKVKFPEFYNYLAMNETTTTSYCEWRAFVNRPRKVKNVAHYGYWTSLGNSIPVVEVSGYKGSWEDSLHKLVKGKWIPVKRKKK